MKDSIKIIVDKLTKDNKTISLMESCTGGGVTNAITNIEGASEILKFSAVTYSNEFKIKFGVKEETINKYSVYSIKVAMEMSKKICEYADSDYGVGITGKLNRVDKNNVYGKDNIVFISIYDKNKDKYTTASMEVNEENRVLNKDVIIDEIAYLLMQVII